MFAEALNSQLLSSSKSSKNLHNSQQQQSTDLSDLQFQLCSNFLKQAKQKLYHQEAELLAISETLLSKVNNRSNMFESQSLKDISGCQDTTAFSFQGEDEDVFSQGCKSMLILRKSKSTACMRRSQSDYSWVMREVEGKCSQRTSQTISGLIEQNKRLKEKNSQIEKKEKQFRKKQLEYEKEQEKIIVLRKKANEYDKVINSLHGQIAGLKLRLRQSQSTVKRSKSPSHDIAPVIQLQTSFKLFLNHKELIISDSTKRLRDLYGEVQKKIEEPFQHSAACEKCCLMLKKIKSSILKYRQLMEAQANAVQALYEKFKTKLK